MKSNAESRSRNRTTFVVFGGLLIAISVVAKLLFEVYIPLGGFPTLRLNLTALPIMLSGIILGPVGGFVVGILSDLLCYVIKPNGPWFIGFTISSGLTGLIPGYLYRLFRKKDMRGIRWINLGFVLISLAILFGSGLFHFENSTLYYSDSPLNPLILVLFVALMLIFSIYPFTAKFFMKDQFAKESEALLVIVTFEQVVNSIILNTWFLTFLYGQAWMILLPGRMITNLFLIPLYTIILAGVLKVIPRKYMQLNVGKVRPQIPV